MQNLELRQADILAGPVERGAFDLVTARAVLHHIADPETAIANMIASLTNRWRASFDRTRFPSG